MVLAAEDGTSSAVLMSGFSQATSLALHEYGDHKLWIADYGASIVYEASFDGESVTSAITSLTSPRYLSFYWSTASSKTSDPSHAPSTGPTGAPSAHPTHSPSQTPSPAPSAFPTIVPTPAPTTGPTPFPSEMPSIVPTSSPTTTSSYLYFTTGKTSDDGKVWRANADGSDPTAFFSGGLPTGLAVETNLQYVFWADQANGTIYRSGLEASSSADCEAIVSGLSKPKQITVSYDHSDDTTGPHVFWTDESEGAIYRSGLDGEDVSRLVTGIDGIGGIVATFESLFYTTPSTNAIYKLSFTCDGADDNGDCTPTQVLIGVCAETDNAGPFTLSYSAQTYLMYAGCATSVVNVKTYDQQGSNDEPIATVVNGLTSSKLNTVVYGWNQGGLFLAAFNMSAVYFLPKDILNYNGGDDDDDSSTARSLSWLKGYSTAVSHASIRSVALYSSGLVESVDDATTTAASALINQGLVAKLVAEPAKLFATSVDASSFEPVSSNQRVVLQQLEEAFAIYGGSNNNNKMNADTSLHAAKRDLATNLAAGAAKASSSSSSSASSGAPFGAAAAGAFFALFAFAAVASGSGSEKRAMGRKQQRGRSERTVPQAAAGQERSGYAQLD